MPRVYVEDFVSERRCPACLDPRWRSHIVLRPRLAWKGTCVGCGFSMVVGPTDSVAIRGAA